MKGANPQIKILVVDDSVENLELMFLLLNERGYDVRLVPSGRLALSALEADVPDLILLDINMPELNGYETCRLVKEDERFKAIPIIFISGLSDTAGIVKGFQAGGVDYVTKPIQIEEVQARIRTHLKIKQLQDELRYQNEHLEELVEARSHELIDVYERLKHLDKVKSDFLLMISYELRTPLNGVLGCSEVAFGLEPKSQLCKEIRIDYDVSKQRMLSLIDDALLINELEAKPVSYGETPTLLLTVIERSIEGAKAMGLKIDEGAYKAVLNGHEIRCNDALMERALITLLLVSHQLNHSKTPMEMKIEKRGHTIRLGLCIVSSELTDAVCETFFEIDSLARSRTKAEPLSLKPVVAERILSLYDGKVAFERKDTESVNLIIELETAKSERGDYDG